MFSPYPRTCPRPQQAAEEYARTLKTFFGAGVAWPEFDLVLLGLGEDGHTASLFPGAAALWVTDRWATSSPPGLLPPFVDRVTLTFPVFNAARQVMFLVSGANKAQAFADVYQGRASVSVRPAAGIRPASGHTVWLSIGRPPGIAGVRRVRMHISNLHERKNITMSTVYASAHTDPQFSAGPQSRRSARSRSCSRRCW